MSETRSVSYLKLGVFHICNSECFMSAIRNTQLVSAKGLFYAKAWLWNIYRMLCSRESSTSQSLLNISINWLFLCLLRSDISSLVSHIYLPFTFRLLSNQHASRLPALTDPKRETLQRPDLSLSGL